MKRNTITGCRCKGCQRILPEGYKYKECEACRNKKVEEGKTIGGVILGALGIAGTVAAACIGINNNSIGKD